MSEASMGPDFKVEEGQEELQQQLLQQALEADPDRPLGRDLAGAVLKRVADLGGSGLFPHEISPALLARALDRIVSNSHFDIQQDEENSLGNPTAALVAELEKLSNNQ